ncbi:Crp/Fnr family transcriptional regulator [Candidatus Bipolaricaulota bacterium]|jgi:CRP-like cAMP-binding protein|nr:Crp/Fnr family transcriptional regulator [Candidatus Bipolaricaulota bacterium]TFH09426.1 MAG: Crp/Fnr family transcriptional regulator [Candidatus Atribacteria bacterium]
MPIERSATNQVLAEEGWESLLRSCEPLCIRYAPGEMICQTGSYVAGIHLVLRGAVSDSVAQTGAERPRCDILDAGDLIGLEVLAASSEALSSSLCRAVTAVELLFIERSQFELALTAHPALQQSVLHYVMARYLEARRAPRESTRIDAECCRLLLRLAASCDPPSEGGVVTFPAEITFRTLRELLGISSRQLREVRQSVQSLKRIDAHITFDEAEARSIADVDPCLSRKAL